MRDGGHSGVRAARRRADVEAAAAQARRGGRELRELVGIALAALVEPEAAAVRLGMVPARVAGDEAGGRRAQHLRLRAVHIAVHRHAGAVHRRVRLVRVAQRDAALLDVGVHGLAVAAHDLEAAVALQGVELAARPRDVAVSVLGALAHGHAVGGLVDEGAVLGRAGHVGDSDVRPCDGAGLAARRLGGNLRPGAEPPAVVCVRNGVVPEELLHGLAVLRAFREGRPIGFTAVLRRGRVHEDVRRAVVRHARAVDRRLAAYDGAFGELAA